MYIHLLEIAIYLCSGCFGDTTEFQFAFRGKITGNYIFEATNCRRIIMIFSLKRALSLRGNRGRCVTSITEYYRCILFLFRSYLEKNTIDRKIP